MVLIHRALHQKGILRVEHASDALLRAFNEDTGQLRVHVVPHSLVRLVPRVLQRN